MHSDPFRAICNLTTNVLISDAANDRLTHVHLMFAWNPSHLDLQTCYANICYSHQDLRHQAFRVDFRWKHLFIYSITPLLYAHLIRSNNVVSASRCSAIHFRGSSIRQVKYYTLLGGFQLPWPPSWCYYGAAPFMVSYERAPKHLIQQLSSSPVAGSAYQKRPTWKRQLPQWFAEVTM